MAIAVEGPGWANPDNVALQVANAIIGHYDCTYGGGAVSAKTGMGPSLQGGEDAVVELRTGPQTREVCMILAFRRTCPAHWLPLLWLTSFARVSRPSTSPTLTLGCWAHTLSVRA